jgi:hypothetical protein
MACHSKRLLQFTGVYSQHITSPTFPFLAVKLQAFHSRKLLMAGKQAVGELRI